MSFETRSPEGPEPPVVSVRGLGKCYPAYRRPSDLFWNALLARRAAPDDAPWALRGVDLDVRPGETVGLIGRNGCGKSTLLQMICGTLQPSEGEVAVRGRVAALLELGAGFNADFTGRENIGVNASILGLTEDEIAQRLDRVIAFAEIGDYIDRPVRFYSSGMFARLAFAVAIHVDPDLLVIDEILAVGDEAFQRRCFARIDEIRAQGAAVLFVSHSASTVVELCDRAVFLDGGRVLFDGGAKEAVTHYHRVLYAPEARAKELIRELAASSAPEPVERQAPPDAVVASPASENGSRFDAGLVPTSTVVYDECGAQISAPQLLSQGGRPVNCLERGDRTVFQYTVRFDEPCFDVRVHMLVKLVSGFELGGGVFPPIAEAGLDFERGAEQIVRFEFDCPLIAGVYFLNCGVTGNGGEQLHRIVDTLMFRVLPAPKETVFGTVDFGCRPSLSDARAAESTP